MRNSDREFEPSVFFLQQIDLMSFKIRSSNVPSAIADYVYIVRCVDSL